MSSNYLAQASAPIDTIIFDLDDTLISWETQTITWPDYLTPMMVRAAGYLNGLGHTVDVEAFGRRFGRNIRTAWDTARAERTWEAVHMAGIAQQTLSDFDIDPSSVDIHALLKAFEWYPMPGVAPFPDTHAVLDTLRAMGYKIGLITNAFQPMWMRDIEIETYGLMGRLDARITSGDTGFMKPHPAIYWRMLGMLDSRPDRAMFVGDSPRNDIAGANKTGMVSVQIDPAHINKSAELDIENADYTITTLSELLPILKTLAG
ncbi:MAG: HAD family hydrolase [Candidatus Promineifilaceae bacterium]